MSDYKTSKTGITVVEGVEIDISVEGDEEVAEKVLLDLTERAGIIAAAWDFETPPSDLPADLDTLTMGENRYAPPFSVAWDRVFEADEDEEGDADE